LLSTGDLLAICIHGRPRDPANGQHKAVVIFTAPTMSAHVSPRTSATQPSGSSRPE
jgi:hypothetical protein